MNETILISLFDSRRSSVDKAPNNNRCIYNSNTFIVIYGIVTAYLLHFKQMYIKILERKGFVKFQIKDYRL